MAQTFLSLRLCLPNHINQILEYTITHTHAQRIYPILICSTLIFHFRNLVWADLCVLTNQIASHFPRRLEVWRWGEVCARWRAATFKKKKKKRKTPQLFYLQNCNFTFFFYILSQTLDPHMQRRLYLRSCRWRGEIIIITIIIVSIPDKLKPIAFLIIPLNCRGNFPGAHLLDNPFFFFFFE